MARKLHITLTGESEKFIKELNRLGLSDSEIIGQSLSVLKMVHETKRVALLKPQIQGRNIEVDYYLVVVERDEEIINEEKVAEETRIDKVVGDTIGEEKVADGTHKAWPRPEDPEVRYKRVALANYMVSKRRQTREQADSLTNTKVISQTERIIIDLDRRKDQITELPTGPHSQSFTRKEVTEEEEE